MRSNRGAARAAVLFGALAVLAIPAGVVAAQFTSQLRLLETLYVVVPAALVLGLVALYARAPRQAERRADALRSRRCRLRARGGVGRRVRGHHGGVGARGVRHPPLGAVAASAEQASTLPGPCSRSGTAFARRASAAGSTSPRPSSPRRSAASTCARSRTSSSRSCRHRPTSRGSCRTYAEYLGLDGQLYVDEFNSRFVSGEEHEPRVRRSAARRPQRRHRRLETNVVFVALARSRS